MARIAGVDLSLIHICKIVSRADLEGGDNSEN